ncbi:MAG TPA: haloacid dehalogenase type II [Stellaceae bacterium]|jgi:2-haloacid dehalogenase|nr:haloacid dehalogenase type II [Stellaceae bacterium]
MPLTGPKPRWLTFDCYGTLIQWDEGLRAAVSEILARHGGQAIEPERLIATYDRHEHALERAVPHRSFRKVAAEGLRRAMADLGLDCGEADTAILTDGIGRMPPFPEVVSTLSALKRGSFGLCIISNTDDAIIAGNVAQLGGHIDRVITAEQAQAYKPSARIFAHAHRALGADKAEIVHICASPHLDLAAARDLGFRAVWIDRGTGRQPLTDYMPDASLPSLDRVPALFRELGWL